MPIACEQRRAAHALWPCLLRWDGGRVCTLPLAQCHRANWSGLRVGPACAAAPGTNGAVVPASPRAAPVPRDTASCGTISVSTCLVAARAVMKIVPLGSDNLPEALIGDERLSSNSAVSLCQPAASFTSVNSFIWFH